MKDSSTFLFTSR